MGGLASENERWSTSVSEFQERESKLPGDVLLTSAFISYAGCFTKKYRFGDQSFTHGVARTFLLEIINHVFRTELLEKHWLPKLTRSIIETTSDLDIIEMLTDDVTVAAWNNEGLPSDRMSVENATILTNCERWPLMIDPQLQGVKWIKQKYGDELVVVRLGQKNYLDTIERAVGNGDVVLLENIEESTDPVLDPLLGRNTIKKGKAIRLGDKEIDFAPTFRLILHTKLANPHYRPEMQVCNVFTEKNKLASAGSRTRIDCLEGNHANRYTTDAR